MKFNTVYNKENHLVLTLSDQCGGAGPASLVYIDTGFVQIFGFKIQDFFQTFFHNNNFFFRLKVIKSVINRGMNKAFLYNALKQKYAQKNSRLFLSFFQTLSPFSRLFLRSWKLLGKFHDCFKTSRLCTNPIKTVFHDVYWASFSLWTPPQSLLLI